MGHLQQVRRTLTVNFHSKSTMWRAVCRRYLIVTHILPGSVAAVGTV